MALMQINLFSSSLMRTVPIQVILPADKLTPPSVKPREDKPYPTLYLLHGIFGNCTDWLSNTRLMRYAEENDLAVVMPSGDNAFYVDQTNVNNNYGIFVGKELVELTRKMLPLSHRREETFIGGLSMGGFGALRNGLKYSETFGRIIALSSALIVEGLTNRTNETPFFIERRDYAEAIFGNLENVMDSDKNPAFLARQIAKNHGSFPEIFMACGEQDSLLPANEAFMRLLLSLHANVTFETAPGGHDWDFWDQFIQKAIQWLPVSGANGISSGNVGI